MTMALVIILETKTRKIIEMAKENSALLILTILQNSNNPVGKEKNVNLEELTPFLPAKIQTSQTSSPSEMPELTLGKPETYDTNTMGELQFTD